MSNTFYFTNHIYISYLIIYYYVNSTKKMNNLYVSKSAILGPIDIMTSLRIIYSIFVKKYLIKITKSVLRKI